ncbi:MAG: formate dehydrogenase accessory sulfurtransferase FdhD [Methanosarcinales archaeon Met12]|nr:MAG: formate dehydrogenase accessory sulfurtransferase FdhD [Methanosarcinales archaeon Met12]
MYLKKFDVVNITRNSKVKSTSLTATEDAITLFVNDAKLASIMATPDMLRELAVGYLVCEGVVGDPSDILDVRLGENLNVYASIKANDRLELWHELHSSGCIGVGWESYDDVHVISDAKFTVNSIVDSLVNLNSDIYDKTRGVHSASLIGQDGNLVAKAIDVGRHNAVDKVIGGAILNGIDLHNVFLLSTGRQSAGMVLKAARIGIPMIVSKTAPIASGIEAAQRVGITLVCFAHEGGLSVYSHPERVV